MGRSGKKAAESPLGGRGGARTGGRVFGTLDSFFIFFPTGKLSLIWYAIFFFFWQYILITFPLRHFMLLGTCRDVEEVCE